VAFAASQTQDSLAVLEQRGEKDDLSPVFLESGVVVRDQGPTLEHALLARVAAGQKGWPDLGLDRCTYLRHMAAHVHAGALPPLAHAADLWLACACAEGLPAAVAEFDRAYRAIIGRAILRVERTAEDDAIQQVMTVLLVRTAEAPPRIAEYGGRAALRTWLATVAVRVSLNLRRRRDVQPHDSVSALADLAANEDLELRLAKTRYGPEVAQAVRRAISGLDARQRVLLRLHHLDGWSIDRLAALYRIGRSTAARWVDGARDALLVATKEDLRSRLGLSLAEVESLLRVLESDLLRVSIEPMLVCDPSGGDPPKTA
jgi:RNA polymerase sigma-70 factor (ECF subfamily)